MLILTRRIGESVIIGNQVTVTVLAFNGKEIRLGGEAPKEVTAHRKEVFDRIKLGTRNRT